MKIKTGLFGYRPPVRLELKEGINQTKFRREIKVLLDQIRHGNSDQKKYARKKLKEEYGIGVYNQKQRADYENQNRQKTVQEHLV
jgi:hypothetical protein